MSLVRSYQLVVLAALTGMPAVCCRAQDSPAGPQLTLPPSDAAGVEGPRGSTPTLPSSTPALPPVFPPPTVPPPVAAPPSVPALPVPANSTIPSRLNSTERPTGTPPATLAPAEADGRTLAGPMAPAFARTRLVMEPGPEGQAETVVLSLANTQAEQMQSILSQLYGSEGILIAPEPRSNSLIVRCHPQMLEQIKALVTRLDRDLPEAPAKPSDATGRRPGGQANTDSKSAIQEYGSSIGIITNGKARAVDIRGPANGGSDLAVRYYPVPMLHGTMNSAEWRAAHEHEARSVQLAQQYVEAGEKTPPGEREELKAKLRKAVEDAFAAKQKAQQSELNQLRERLKRIEQQMEAREKQRDKIIERRMEDLLDPTQRWDTELQAAQASAGPAWTAPGFSAGGGATLAPPYYPGRANLMMVPEAKANSGQAPIVTVVPGSVPDGGAPTYSTPPVFPVPASPTPAPTTTNNPAPSPANGTGSKPSVETSRESEKRIEGVPILKSVSEFSESLSRAAKALAQAKEAQKRRGNNEDNVRISQRNFDILRAEYQAQILLLQSALKEAEATVETYRVERDLLRDANKSNERRKIELAIERQEGRLASLKTFLELYGTVDVPDPAKDDEKKSRTSY